METPQLNKQDIASLLFNDGIYDSKVVYDKNLATKLRSIDPNEDIWHVDIENIDPPSKGDGITVWKTKSWRESQVHRDDLKSKMAFEKFKLDRRSERIKYVRVKLVEVLGNEKVADEFISRALNPQNESDIKYRDKFKLDFTIMDRESEEIWKTDQLTKLNQ